MARKQKIRIGSTWRKPLNFTSTDFLPQTCHFEIVRIHRSCKGTTERSHIPFTQFSPVVTFSEPENWNQYNMCIILCHSITQIDSCNHQNNHDTKILPSSQKPLVLPQDSHTFLPHHHCPLATTDLFSMSITVMSRMSHKWRYVTFCNWLFSLIKFF